MPDVMTKAQRSVCMSHIRGANTGPERNMFRLLCREGVYFARHAREIPGRPDIVFRRCRLAVFIDGEFWHGRRISEWRRKLSGFWREKIEGNRRRDRRVDRALRARGWSVLHLWAEKVESDPERCLRRVLRVRQRQIEKPRPAHRNTVTRIRRHADA